MLKHIQTQVASANRLKANLILNCDSYKYAHSAVYARDVNGQKIIGAMAYVEPRRKGHLVVPCGMQMLIRKELLDPITMADILEAEEFAAAHGVAFYKEDWLYVLEKYHGFMPLKIRAVKEGMILPSGNALVTIECMDEKVWHLASYFETMLQRGIWYPTTIASNDLKKYDLLQRYARLTVDDDLIQPVVRFGLHDFAGRGVTCEEQAQIGGMAHTIFFQGSDTISGIRAANFYYFEHMAAYSVNATEHSVQTSYGPDHQDEYLHNVLDTYAKPGMIVSIVLDGYDLYREVDRLCTGELRQKIIDSGAKVVFRPDSGEPAEIIKWLLQKLEVSFGFTVNKKGYKVLNHVAIIQGDGINYSMIETLLKLLEAMGFASSNLVFGSGGDLLQNAMRDDLSFAQKLCAVLTIDDVWHPIFKDPVTDQGKKSKAGHLTTVRSRMTGEYSTVIVGQYDTAEFEDMMWDIYDHGVVPNVLSLMDLRYNAGVVSLADFAAAA